jgi:recombination protein RecR
MNDNLVALLQRLPGVGPKQAKRFVYALMKSDKYYKDNIIREIQILDANSKLCSICYRWHSYKSQDKTTICNICADQSRDSDLVMLVEKELDIDALERTGAYHGLYFVLGSVLPILAINPTEIIRVRELTSYIKSKIDADNLSEIIFALPVTDEGDYTVEYLENIINQIVGADRVKRSHLARGLSSGLELEYVDKATFANALNGRN